MDAQAPHPANGNGNVASPVRTGPLSRAWPQLFKKRRRQHSPARDVSTPMSVLSVSSGASSEHSSSTPPPFRVPIPKRTMSIGTVVLPDNASTSTNSTGQTSTQADLLASKSNYEWIAEGRHAEMGLHFSTAMATGVMMRRATHRAAEQARRDRMKGAMVDLAEHLLDGEVTFGSGTSCFVVSRGDKEGNGSIMEEDEGGIEGEGKTVQGKGANAGKKGQNINKARIIEMALEKLKRQEREIKALEEQVRECSCRMDMSE